MKSQVRLTHQPSLSEVAYQALTTEAEGLLALRDDLDESFSQTVHLIHSIKGRVIVSGMGKCNHIANKLAATFSSTGCPSFFVHPGEASHGDLGMITPDDLVIILSYSGETSELSNIISYTRRFSIPLIAITGRKQSTLAKIANVCLALPEAKEACPMGLAPTTSTTMMLALGDALAIALLTEKGFTAQDFKVFHPGGNLGNQLTRLSEKMHTGNSIPLIFQDSFMDKALLTMTEKGFGCVGCIDESGFLRGIVTDGDLRRHMNSDLLQKKVHEVMTEKPTTAQETMLMVEALALMNQKNITSLFIIDPNNKPVGIIHVHDFLRAGII